MLAQERHRSMGDHDPRDQSRTERRFVHVAVSDSVRTACFHHMPLWLLYVIRKDMIKGEERARERESEREGERERHARRSPTRQT